MSIGIQSLPPRPYPRHPLGLPAGSVRALLTLLVLGIIWAVMLVPDEKNAHVPLYLYYLMFLMLGSFFAAHGHSIAGPTTAPGSPLHLPKGSLRALMVLGFIAVFGWRFYQNHDVENFLKLRQPEIDTFALAYLPMVLIAAFFLGVFLSAIAGRLFTSERGVSPAYQDIQAWLALLAALLLVGEFILHVFVNPSLDLEKRIGLGHWQLLPAGIVAFYFGARS